MSDDVRCNSNSALVRFAVAISVTLCLNAVADEFGRTASVPAADDLPISVAAPLPDQPAWLLGQFQIGGEFLTNSPCHALRSSDTEECRSSVWYVPAETPEGEGSLFVMLDRALLTNDLTIELNYLDKKGSSLYLDLLATNMATVGTNLFGNLIAGSNDIVCLELPIPLDSYPLASIIRLWRGVGTILVFESRLYEASDTREDTTTEVTRTAQAQATTVFPPISDTPAGTSEIQTQAEPPTAWDENAIDPLTNITNGPIVHVRIPANRIVYVNQLTGNDAFSGSTPVPTPGTGPKKTISAGLSAVGTDRWLVIDDGAYGEDLNVSGRDVVVRVEGDVNLSSMQDMRLRAEQSSYSPLPVAGPGVSNSIPSAPIP